MDYEKKYKEVLERAKESLKDGGISQNSIDYIQSIFPELKESEDDRIRKSLIILLQHFCKGYRVSGLNFSVSYKDMLAWLEKQGEQEQDPCEHCKDKCLNCHNFPCIEKRAFEQGKSVFDVINEEKVDNADKVEPKFKVSDWITNGATKPAQISSIEDDMYYTHNGTIGGDIESMDKDYHLWTIEDAKDGDVLVASDGSIFLFKGVIDCACKHYVALTTDGAIKFNEGLEHFWETSRAVHPATKEQRDTLFAKMKEAGYAFDFETKELKKLGQPEVTKTSDQEEIAEIPFGAKDSELQEATYYIPKGFHAEIDDDKVVIKKGEKHIAWSEEDERNLKGIIDEIESNKNFAPASDNVTYDRYLSWLKSLRTKNTWKPSEEQMDALETAVSSLQSNSLESLYQDLKREKNYE